MKQDKATYRLLQQHLDKQAVGFPATWSGVEIFLLQKLFTPDEAKLALHLSYKSVATGQVIESVRSAFSPEQVQLLLDSMFRKGAIGWRKENGDDHWFIIPFVIGMYEAQDGHPSPAYLDNANAYMKTLSFGKSFLAVNPPQMRTIPINRSILAEHHVATYDQIRTLVLEAPGPFAALNCICRESKAMRNKACTKTDRRETCLAFGDWASMVLRRSHGREVTQEEVLAILERNEDEGLVLQPSNTRQLEFVCSCCGCCCGMLSFQKFMPHPLDFWTSNFHAAVDSEVCISCGTCVARCQVNAAALTGPSGVARIDLNRCIGCGLCVSTCPADAIQLKKNNPETIPPKNAEDLYDEIMANKKGSWEKLQTVLKVALRMKQ